jgi:perosamine synthetase
MAHACDVPFGRLESAAVLEVVASGRLWRGNGAAWGSQQDSTVDAVADRLEDAIGRRLGLPYVHAVNSGTSANEAAIASLGLEPGDEVICPAACPVFVPFAVFAAGCIPVFADVDPETMLLDPSGIETVISERTRALVVVHLWGLPAPMPQIMEVAAKSGLKVVEDCAQAFGTLIDGQPAGTFGDACCYSLQQSKHITSGEGGIFATRSAEGYARAVLYSNGGIPSFRFGVSVPRDDFDSAGRGHLQFGHNHRISELQAAVALAQLSRIDEFVRRRAELVELINTDLRRRNSTSVRMLATFPKCTISYWRYPILVPPGRGTYLEVPYLEPAFLQINDRRLTPFGISIPQYVNYERGACPNAEKGASQIRVLSVHHSLTAQELHNIVKESLADL